MKKEKKLKVVHIVSEVAPFSKTGGLGDVSRSLPKALKRLGHDVFLITPLYGKVIDKKRWGLKLIFSDVNLRLNSKESIKVNYWQGYLMEDLPVYFIENVSYFSKSRKIYGSSHENARFLIFNVAALKLLSLLKKPVDIIHCHDWQSGLVPYYLKTDFRYSKTLKKAKTVFTIHNLIFQFGHNWWEVPLEHKDYGRSRLPHLSDKRIEYINFAKRAILSADIINTVSEQYRQEIMTKKFGQDLHRILKNRSRKLYGIINGIDYNTYNPEKDESLHKVYSYETVEHKTANKRYLQNKIGLPEDKKIPILCTTSRVTFQKGFNLILKIMEPLLKMDLQLVFMGDGNKEYIQPIKKLQRKFPKKIVWLPFDQEMETLLYAASDLFLLPSNHEPCGINQLIAMRYGCIPVVREIGGLYDTVDNFNPAEKKGNGFTFSTEDSYMFYAAIIRALENYKHTRTWQNLVVRVMRQSNSWEIPAKKYVELYRAAVTKK
ncbi:MAG: glycogen/starch synthase [Patescibacteria group bacterium]|nr:glycogen/starch synthase [Patescibacteria group bacterium]MDD4443906.1 glycogen/starch synthase [Patescibacteria group bacterium]